MGLAGKVPTARPDEASPHVPAGDSTRSGPAADGGASGSRTVTGPDPPTRPPASKETERHLSSADAANPRPRLRRLWMAIVAVLAALGGLIGLGWFLLKPDDADERHLELMGNIDVRQVNLAFKVDGRIETLAVDEGDAVKAGDVIGTLDKRYFNDDLRVLRARRENLAASVAKLENGSRPEEIAQARAQTADREAALVKAKEDIHRAEALVDKGGVSRQEFDRYQSSLKSAEAMYKSASESQRLVEIGPRQEDIDIARAALAEQDATIAQSERRLSDADLIAPNDGTILTRARERGAIVQPGETVFTLTLASPVWVRTYVNERDLGLIQPEMSVEVITDSAPSHPYVAQIGFISPTAEFTPKNVETRELRTDLVYRLRVVVDNPDGGLRQGMPVTVRVALTQPRARTFWQRAGDAIRARLHLGN
jgi:HlyD family secretion protein